jgi:uncharacterized protein (DUF488 family)
MLDIMEQRRIAKQMGNQPTGDRGRILTVGHSRHDWPYFLRLLQEAGVTAVADVRSQPHSQWCPQFNRPELERSLRQQQLAYVFLGAELGGRPSDSDLYDEEGRVQYESVRATPEFKRGLERVLEAREHYNVALLCSEEDPLDCHRGLMIAPALVERGQAPQHLRGNGVIESMRQFEDQLLRVTRVGEGMFDGLFADLIPEKDRNDYLVKAYRLQARRKAFRLRRDETP